MILTIVGIEKKTLEDVNRLYERYDNVMKTVECSLEASSEVYDIFDTAEKLARYIIGVNNSCNIPLNDENVIEMSVSFDTEENCITEITVGFKDDLEELESED